MQQRLTRESLAELTAFASAPCLSLYQPTHRAHPENQQDLLRFGQGIQTLERSLKEQYSTADAQALLAPFRALAAEPDFWNHTLDGLAVLGGPGLFRVFMLARPVGELAVVADSFHTKPLRRFLQSDSRYQVLGLSRQAVRLFEGDRDSLSEIELESGVPQTIDDALGDQLSQAHHAVASYGGVGGASSPMHHGHGGKKDEIDKDAERFFRVVDRAVIEHYSKPSGLPLILAALPEHHHLFHKISHNALLLKASIDGNPDAMGVDQLCRRAWQTLEPEYLAKQAQWADEFGLARSRGLGSDNLAEVAKAAAQGRVSRLLIEAERQIPGHLDTSSGIISDAELTNPQVDDLLDDLGELVEKMGGQVHVLPAQRMPSDTGLAATYRH
jgi:hypothetical protein